VDTCTIVTGAGATVTGVAVDTAAGALVAVETRVSLAGRVLVRSLLAGAVVVTGAGAAVLVSPVGAVVLAGACAGALGPPVGTLAEPTSGTVDDVEEDEPVPVDGVDIAPIVSSTSGAPARGSRGFDVEVFWLLKLSETTGCRGAATVRVVVLGAATVRTTRRVVAVPAGAEGRWAARSVRAAAGAWRCAAATRLGALSDGKSNRGVATAARPGWDCERGKSPATGNMA
jgi:hypothetical protein